MCAEGIAQSERFVPVPCSNCHWAGVVECCVKGTGTDVSRLAVSSVPSLVGAEADGVHMHTRRADYREAQRGEHDW